jgi:hypothetical protein
VPKAADLERDDLQSGPMLRAERIDPAQRLLDVLNPHGNMPPVENAGHRLASGCKIARNNGSSAILVQVSITSCGT